MIGSVQEMGGEQQWVALGCWLASEFGRLEVCQRGGAANRTVNVGWGWSWGTRALSWDTLVVEGSPWELSEGALW